MIGIKKKHLLWFYCILLVVQTACRQSEYKASEAKAKNTVEKLIRQYKKSERKIQRLKKKREAIKNSRSTN